MKIAVALSGGVDSTAAAAFLLQEGHRVFGVTMKHYDPVEAGFNPGEGIDKDIEDARNVCLQLGIEHHIIDLRFEFDRIKKYLIDDYQQGRTPNPCTLCNPTIKWGALLKKCRELGAEKIATGHYVDLRMSSNLYRLYRAKDLSKDQTYMLWRLNQEQLSFTLFPNAHRIKREIRESIRKLELPVHDRNESQEICFIKDDYQSYLNKKLTCLEGDILFRDGIIIGRHHGLYNYTIGQRKGLNLPWRSALYVSEIDPGNNTITVTDDQRDLMKNEFEIGAINWIAGTVPKDFNDTSVQIRYNSVPKPLKKIRLEGEIGSVSLKTAARAVTPGQSAVFYRDDQLLGGGIIK